LRFFRCAFSHCCCACYALQRLRQRRCCTRSAMWHGPVWLRFCGRITATTPTPPLLWLLQCGGHKRELLQPGCVSCSRRSASWWHYMSGRRWRTSAGAFTTTHDIWVSIHSWNVAGRHNGWPVSIKRTGWTHFLYYSSHLGSYDWCGVRTLDAPPYRAVRLAADGGLYLVRAHYTAGHQCCLELWRAGFA